MALKWINIRSGEKVVAETEPQIAGLWSSSDHSPNITQGQDFGWRLAPEIVVEMKKIKQDMDMLERIARRFGKSVDDVVETDILTYISNKTKLEEAPQPEANQFEDEYDQQIRALEGKNDKTVHDLFADDEGAKPLSMMSTEELAAELERRKAGPGPTTTTTTTTK